MAMVRSHVVGLGILLALVACKDKPAATPEASRHAPAATSSPGSDATPKPVGSAAPRPALPTPPPPPSGVPITIPEIEKVLPAIEGTQIVPLKQTSDKRQVHGTWCIDGDGAEDVARKVGRMMATAGYTGLSIRGNAKKAGVQAERDGYRMSMVVSASSAASCAAPLHYFASATIFRP